MRIAEVSTRYPPGPGGVERHVREVSTRFAARGNEVSAYTTDLYREYPWDRLPRSVPRRETVDAVRVVRLRAFSLPGELHYPFLPGLGKALERDRPDLVHVHTYGTHQVAVARRFFRRTRTPFVLTAHYHPIWSIEGGWLRHRLRGFYDQKLAARDVGAASRLIVQSMAEERLVRQNGFPLPPVVTIPPGYTPLPPPATGDRSFARSIDVPGPFVLFVGRLASNKGLLTLVDAFQTLSQKDPSAYLVLVGEDGGMRRRVEERIGSLGLGSRVRFTGFIADEARLAAAFSEARLFVLPSEYEAFGLVLLEALAQGTPVLASNVGGIPEFIEDGRSGLLVRPGDPGEWRRALVSLWEDEAGRRRMGEWGREQVVPRYTWEKVVDRLRETFESVLGR